MSEQDLAQARQENTKLLKQMLDCQKRNETSSSVSITNAANIDKILFLLNGNGSPSNGLVYKVDRVYEWMSEHTVLHEEQKQEQKDAKKTSSDRRWDIISGIIKWITPVLVYGVAYFIVTYLAP